MTWDKGIRYLFPNSIRSNESLAKLFEISKEFTGPQLKVRTQLSSRILGVTGGGMGNVEEFSLVEKI